MTERSLEVTHHGDVEDMRGTPPDSEDRNRAGGKEPAAKHQAQGWNCWAFHWETSDPSKVADWKMNAITAGNFWSNQRYNDGSLQPVAFRVSTATTVKHCVFLVCTCRQTQNSTYESCDQGHRSRWMKLAYSFFFSMAVLRVSPVTWSYAFRWNHSSLRRLIPQSLSIGGSGFYVLTIPNGLNAHARSTRGFIPSNMPFSKSTLIYISAGNCLEIPTGNWKWR